MSSDRTNQKLIHVMTFGGSHAAHVAMAALSDHGITAHVQGDALADALSYYGPAVSKVQLMTFEDDAEQALQILQELEAVSRQADEAWGDGDYLWVCESCGEHNARTFDQCWSCGADRPDNPQRVPVDAPEAPEIDVAGSPANAPDNDSPYRTPLSEASVALPQDVSRLEERALRAANISALMFPVGFYALYLCFRCFSVGLRSKRLWLATLLSLITSGFTLAMVTVLG
ncbi:MAG: hypothetical protein NXI04_27020 [Planctomycetaceae bacterium]|nr:hypothetical protein [Planctomycetaceae bacterium]